MDQLKLVALDDEDIAIMSAHVQDAVLKAADIRWRPSEHRVVLGLDRFDWTAAHCGSPEFRRCRSALRFERVLSCKCRNLDAGKGELNLLAVAFEQSAWRSNWPISARPGSPNVRRLILSMSEPGGPSEQG